MATKTLQVKEETDTLISDHISKFGGKINEIAEQAIEQGLPVMKENLIMRLRTEK